MTRPKVLFVATVDWYLWAHRSALARAVSDAGFEVSIATARGELESTIEQAGFRFHAIRIRRDLGNPLYETLCLAELAQLYRRIRPDLVHHFALKAALLGGLAARGAGIPAVVNTVAGLGYLFTGAEDWKKGVLRRAASAGLALAFRGRRTRVLFENPDDQGLFVQRKLVREAQCRVVPGTGVDTECFVPTPEREGRPVVLFASRMLWDKGVRELVEAIELLKGEGLSFDAVFAGMLDPSNPAAIAEAELRRWHDAGLISWIGQVSDMPAQFARSHIVCLPSYREGLPRTLLEAAACGRPCVATDVPGCRLVVKDGISGFLVPPTDARALADAIGRLIRDADLRQRMGQAGRRIVEQSFTEQIVADQVLSIYHEVLRA